MILTKKRSGKIKGRCAYNGKPTRVWIDKNNKSSPTVLTESLFLTCAIDAKEGQDVLTLDIPNAFIQAGLPEKQKGERIIMKIRGRLVDWLLKLDPEAYQNEIVYKRIVKTLYVKTII